MELFKAFYGIGIISISFWITGIFLITRSKKYSELFFQIGACLGFISITGIGIFVIII